MRLTDAIGLAVTRGMHRFATKRGFVLPIAVGANAVDVAERALDKARDTRARLDASLEPSIPTEPHKTAAPSGRGMMGSALGLPGGMTVRSGAGGGMSMPPWLQGMAQGAATHAQTGAGKGLEKGVGDVAALPLSGLAHGLGGVMDEGLKRLFFGREFGERKDPLHMAGSAAVQTFGKGVGEMGVDLLKDLASKAVAAVGNVGQDAARQAILHQLKGTDPVLAEADDKVLMDAYHTMVRFAPVLSTDANAVRSFLRTAVTSGAGPDFASIKQLADAERAVTGQRKE